MDNHLQESKSEEVIMREEFERSLVNAWGYSSRGIEAKRAAMTMLSTKTGMFARIPLMCKADSCPYSESCAMLPYGLAPIGEPCVVETAQVELRLAGYNDDFQISESSFTDKNLINDLIHNDIMLDRCKALLQKEGVLVQDVIAGIAENGQEFTRPEVSKSWEAYERVQKKRNDIYELMVATRKHKKGTGEGTTTSLGSFISNLAEAPEFVVEERPDNI